jgi:GNAT superfamily N-acetyltransferase
MESKEALSIISLGNSIDRKQTRLWRWVEEDIFGNDPNHVPVIPNINLSDDTEFFIAYNGERPIGRVAASIDREWISERGDNLGFLNDFVIAPDYQRLGEDLIDRGLSVLKAKGVDGAVVRWSGFPALAAEGFGDDVPPTLLACNPPWYIDLFERKGFTKHLEWVNCRFGIPPHIPEEGVARGQKVVKALGLKFGLLKWRSRRQVDEFLDLQDVILEGRNGFGYSPKRPLKKDAGFLPYLIYVLAAKLTKTSAIVLEDESGKIVACQSFCPNHNVPLKSLRNRKRSWIRPQSWGTVAVARYFIELRRTRRGEITSFGFAPELRGRNLIAFMDYSIGMIASQGYSELDTGPVRAEAPVPIKVAERLAKKYDKPLRRTSYYTLLHKF